MKARIRKADDFADEQPDRVGYVKEVSILLLLKSKLIFVLQSLSSVRICFHLLFVFILIAFHSNAQSIQLLTSGTSTSIRGLSVVNDSVLWASGSNGTV